MGNAPLDCTTARSDSSHDETVDPLLVRRVLEAPRYAQAKFAERIDRLPYFRRIESPSGPHIVAEGRTLANFASNDYLGMANDPRVIRGAREALDRWGFGVTGSRLMNGNLVLHGELEEEIAGFLAREASLVFPTGYTANLGLLAGLLRPSDVVVADQEIHASCLDGARLSGARLRRFRHNDVASCAQIIERESVSPSMCVIEGVYSMSGDIAPVRAIADLCRRSKTMLVVDEAHALGVVGATGGGAVEESNATRDVDAVVLTFSKALGGCGGAVAGSRGMIDALRFSARPFLFTASSTPSSIAGALTALRILARNPDYSRAPSEHASSFAEILTTRGVERLYGGGAIVSVPTGSDLRTAQAWKMLWNRSIYCNASMTPAVPPGAGALRFSFIRTQLPKEISHAANTCAMVLEEIGLLDGGDEIA